MCAPSGPGARGLTAVVGLAWAAWHYAVARGRWQIQVVAQLPAAMGVLQLRCQILPLPMIANHAQARSQFAQPCCRTCQTHHQHQKRVQPLACSCSCALANSSCSVCLARCSLSLSPSPALASSAAPPMPALLVGSFSASETDSCGPGAGPS